MYAFILDLILKVKLIPLMIVLCQRNSVAVLANGHGWLLQQDEYHMVHLVCASRTPPGSPKLHSSHSNKAPGVPSTGFTVSYPYACNTYPTALFIATNFIIPAHLGLAVVCLCYHANSLSCQTMLWFSILTMELARADRSGTRLSNTHQPLISYLLGSSLPQWSLVWCH